MQPIQIKRKSYANMISAESTVTELRFWLLWITDRDRERGVWVNTGVSIIVGIELCRDCMCGNRGIVRQPWDWGADRVRKWKGIHRQAKLLYSKSISCIGKLLSAPAQCYIEHTLCKEKMFSNVSISVWIDSRMVLSVTKKNTRMWKDPGVFEIFCGIKSNLIFLYFWAYMAEIIFCVNILVWQRKWFKIFNNGSGSFCLIKSHIILISDLKFWTKQSQYLIHNDLITNVQNQLIILT